MSMSCAASQKTVHARDYSSVRVDSRQRRVRARVTKSFLGRYAVNVPIFTNKEVDMPVLNPLTAGAAYIRVFIFY